jgi:hypothetical protein
MLLSISFSKYLVVHIIVPEQVCDNDISSYDIEPWGTEAN